MPYSDCNGLCFNDFDGDGVCDRLEVYGCSEFDACNFNPGATEDDGTCDYSCFGCTDPEALNWDEAATVDDGSCTYFERLVRSSVLRNGPIWGQDCLPRLSY